LEVLPGTTYRPADLARLLFRRRWWLILPLTAGTVVFSFFDGLVTGAVAGLVVGAVIVGFHEYRDSSFSSEDDVSRVLMLPVLGAIPEMMSETEQQRQRSRRLIREVLTAAAALLAVLWAVWRARSFGQ
jgi:uncharacterized membrane protein